MHWKLSGRAASKKDRAWSRQLEAELLPTRAHLECPTKPLQYMASWELWSERYRYRIDYGPLGAHCFHDISCEIAVSKMRVFPSVMFLVSTLGSLCGCGLLQQLYLPRFFPQLSIAPRTPLQWVVPSVCLLRPNAVYSITCVLLIFESFETKQRTRH